MADLTLASRPVSLSEGYASRTIDVDGVPMTFTFYMGFASRVTYTPKNGPAIVVYEQEGVFHVPGGVGPDPISKLTIQGGPDALDVELEIDDNPMLPPSYRGPVGKIDVKTKKRVADPKGNGKHYKVLKGAHQIEDVTVTPTDPTGGVFAHQTVEGGGTTSVDNKAATCPPNC
jgi:hypothetical protein